MGYINSNYGYKTSHYNWPLIVVITLILVVAIGMGLVKFQENHGEVSPSSRGNIQVNAEQHPRIAPITKPIPKPVSDATAKKQSTEMAKAPRAPIQQKSVEVVKQPEIARTQQASSSNSDIKKSQSAGSQTSENDVVSTVAKTKENVVETSLDTSPPKKDFYCSASDEQAGFCQSK